MKKKTETRKTPKVKLVKVKANAVIIQDPDDIARFAKMNDLYSVTWDLMEWLRQEVKYNNKPYGKVRDKLSELLADKGINMNELYY